MSNIKIEWLTDTTDHCELCGPSYAEGAIVHVDGELVLDLAPSAGCTACTHYSEQEVYDRLLAHLGHSVEHA